MLLKLHESLPLRISFFGVECKTFGIGVNKTSCKCSGCEFWSGSKGLFVNCYLVVVCCSCILLLVKLKKHVGLNITLFVRTSCSQHCHDNGNICHYLNFFVLHCSLRKGLNNNKKRKFSMYKADLYRSISIGYDFYIPL